MKITGFAGLLFSVVPRTHPLGALHGGALRLQQLADELLLQLVVDGQRLDLRQQLPLWGGGGDNGGARM